MKRIIIAILLCVTLVVSVAGCQRVNYLEKSVKGDLKESVDFIQYWYYKDFSDADWSNLYKKLKSVGYESIILQHTCVFDENGFVLLGDGTDFYPTKTVQSALGVAEKENFGVYVGLATSDLWWKANNYAAKADEWARYEAEAVKRACAVAKNFESFKGFYMPLEAYTNGNGYEKHWAKIFNAAIEKIEEIAPEYPLICSPYKSKVYPMSKSAVYSFAKSFISLIDFRKHDIIAPQDGSGNAASDFTDKSLGEVVDFLSAFYTASTECDKCVFGFNTEYFTDKKGVYATEKRKEKQREIANDYASIILSFSYSHYFA